MNSKRIIIDWLPLAAVITLLSLMVYGVAQQTTRLSANEPQIQLAHDVAQRIVDGATPISLVGPDKIEITNKLAPYVIIYDAGDKILASSAVLNGQAPTIPAGVIDYTREHGENRVTWQPESGVRQALVAVKYGGSGNWVVVAGRSLSEPERLIGLIGRDVLIGWVITLAASLAVVFTKATLFE